MYDATDPRSTLATATKIEATSFAGSYYGRFYEMQPQENGAWGRTWYARGQNFLIAYSDVKAGTKLSRMGQVDEYVVLLPEAKTSAEIKAADGVAKLDGFSIAILPPGDSDVTALADGPVVRIFSAQSPDLNEKCSNADSYAMPHPNIPPFQPWPTPRGGYRTRTYSLDVPAQPGRFGRIFRCTTLMVNFLDPKTGPRDITKLSPHHHDDFEQCSLALQGEFTHDIRWPWIPNMKEWREDEHGFCASPSIVVIPPPAVHTSRAQGKGLNQLVDIFGPPRVDFSIKPGWVLNEDEYPMPPGV